MVSFPPIFPALLILFSCGACAVPAAIVFIA
jgi:hypothetical protein